MQRDAAVLTVPATADYARAVRMFAANLAVTAELTIDEVDDLRMAADEGFVYACATEPSQVEIRFVLNHKQVEIEYTLGEKTPDTGDTSLEFSSLLLQALCDVYEIDVDGHVLHLVKTGLES